MIFPAVYVSVTLFLIPSLYGDDDYCKLAFEYDGLDDAFDCNTTSLTNLTKESYEGALEIIDATESHSEFDGDKVFELDCCFYSQPYCPIITWYKDGVEIKDGLTTRKIKQGRTLQVFAKLDAGGNYTCNATTPYGEVESHTITNIQVIRRCSEKFTVVTTPDHEDVIKGKRGSRQKLVWNFICFGALHSKTVRCKRNNSEEITERDGYYNITRNRSGKNNEVALQLIITISNFSRSENITCTTDADGSPSATLTLVVEEEAAVGQRQTNNEESFFKEKGVWIVVGISLLLSFVAVLLLLWCKKKVGRKIQIFYHPKEKEVAARYDAFISYSEADGGSFVRSTLKPMLEDECGYKLSLHYREFVPGTAIVDNIIDSIYHSRRIVTIVTPNFLESEWCKFEVNQGLHRAIEKKNSLVVVMLHEMPKKQLPKSLRLFLSGVTFLQWDDGKRDEMRKKMKSALGTPFTLNHIDGQGENEVGVEIAFEERNNSQLQENGKKCDPSNPQVIWSDNAAVNIV